MFGGDSDPKSVGTDGRFFVDSLWRSPESVSSGPENMPAQAGSLVQSRQGFGTFGKALEQLMRDSGSPKKPGSAPTNNDISTLQSLYISDVPENLMDKGIMMKHFSQFGTVTRVSVSMKRKSCTVHFEDHETADKAKAQGAMLENDVLNIFWSRPGNTRRADRKFSDSSTLRSRIKLEQSTGQKGAQLGIESYSKTSEDTKIKSNLGIQVEQSLPIISIPNEVKDELDAMAMSDYSQPLQRPITERRSVKKSPKKEFGARHINKKRPIRSEPSHGSSHLKSKVSATILTDKEMAYSSSASTDELQKILRTPAHSAEERYRVLEARDKLMRMKRVRQSDLKKARGNQGTCPDMCPEKERYHREYQRQVAPYELLLPGKMDRSKAVKEYSRSSADQEEPLSHELRSTCVLRMTMDYLIWNLMDLCNKKEENLQNWYHFIWDRTRSIRKDITQQDLCDKDTVVLVEQCARFHIFCSERLIAEDLSIYDDKINTENLTKCLQTLKYMYHDLSLKGITCPHEAEFRAYFVLLNLNEGDCMWEVQQLSATVRQSDPVRFALQVSAALSSNNYIRFFKLVRSSTYLNTCILHRYFGQVRSQALSTILKAFCSRVETVFTLEEVVRLTGFENTQEAAVLCSHHGLQLAADGLGVIFSRFTYCQPDTILTTTRSLSLIEAKCLGSVAEVVSGGIPSQLAFQSHIPHDSFSRDGVLKMNAWKALDQQSSEVQVEGAEGSIVFLKSDVPCTMEEQDITPEQDNYVADKEAERQRVLLHHALKKEIEQTASNLISQVINDEVCSIVENTLKDAHIEFATDELCSEVFTEVTADLMKGICEEVMTAELCLEEQREYAKQQEVEADMRNKLIESKAIQEFNIALNYEIGEICKAVIDDELARDELGKQWCEEILQEVVQEECKKLFQDAIEEVRAVKLNTILTRVQSRRLKHFFYKWRSLVNKSKMMQKSMVDFPAWMCNMSLDEQVSGLQQPDSSFIQHLAEKRRSGEKTKPVDSFCELPIKPIVKVGSAIAPHLAKRMKELSCYNANTFWKVVVSLPDAEEITIFDAIRRWTNSVFSLDSNLSFLSQTKPNAHETVSVCLRCVTGSVTDVDACGGINGIFFWLPHKERSRKTCQRLLAVLSAKPPCPAVPVAFVFTGPTLVDGREIINELAVEKLKESSFISQYKFFYRNDNTHKGLADQMRNACQWLARCTPSPAPLFVTSMKQLVNQCITDELWERIRGNDDNQNPNTMVNLYNTALQKLLDLLSDGNLKLFSLGAAEFHRFLCDDYIYREQSRYQIAPEYWGSKQYFSTIAKFLSNAQLSPLALWPPLSVEDLRETISDYCTSQRLPHLIGDLFHILQQHHLANQLASFPPSAPSSWKQFLQTLPWFRILQTVAEAKLEAMDCGFVSRSVSNQDDLLVIIHHESLRQFRCAPWWIAAPQESNDSKPPSDKNHDGCTQKRPLVNETMGPRKQQRLSLSDALTEIKAAVSKIDSTMKNVKITQEKILAIYDNMK